MIQDREESTGKINKMDEQALEEELVRFSPEEELALLEESNSYKAQANQLFSQNAFNDAIEKYKKALSCCPNYRDYEIAVLNSNLAAVYLGIRSWKEAALSASSSLDSLKKLEDNNDLHKKGKDKESSTISGQRDEKLSYDEKDTVEKVDEEIISAAAAKAEKTNPNTGKMSDNEKIKIKALMRRGKANFEMGGWSTLHSAQEDYNLLSQMPNLSPADRKIVERQLVLLPPKIKAAQEKEMGELIGGLKKLGNFVLNPFGLSTENFKMQKDEKSGSYSMNFQSN